MIILKQKYQAITNPASEGKHIHHTGVYTCDKNSNNNLLEKYLDTVFDCTNSEEYPPELNLCFNLYFGSANAQDQVMMPKEAGLPLTNGTYFLTNIHVTNLKMINVKFSHKMRIWHTGHLRKYEASYKTIGGNPGLKEGKWGAILPPGIPQFRSRHVLSTHCLNEVLLQSNYSYNYSQYFCLIEDGF